MSTQERENCITIASQESQNAVQYIKTTVTNHLKIIKVVEERTWLKDNFISKAQAVLDEWEKIKDSLRSDTFYQGVSLEEKMAIVKSFDFCKFRINPAISFGTYLITSTCGAFL